MLSLPFQDFSFSLKIIAEQNRLWKWGLMESASQQNTLFFARSRELKAVSVNPVEVGNC
jgi:hypothetical protein